MTASSSGLRRGWIGNRSILALTVLAFLAGCSGGDGDVKPTAKVSGKVSYDGKPVTGGILMFSPIGTEKNNKPGKAGQATIKPDGSFTVTTYSEGDGAVIGSHRVLYSPPPPAAPASAAGGHAEASGPSPFDGLVSKQAEYAVAKGENKLDVELVKGNPAPK